jgi:hypothetical protein
VAGVCEGGPQQLTERGACHKLYPRPGPSLTSLPPPLQDTYTPCSPPSPRFHTKHPHLQRHPVALLGRRQPLPIRSQAPPRVRQHTGHGAPVGRPQVHRLLPRAQVEHLGLTRVTEALWRARPLTQHSLGRQGVWGRGTGGDQGVRQHRAGSR